MPFSNEPDSHISAAPPLSALERRCRTHGQSARSGWASHALTNAPARYGQNGSSACVAPWSIGVPRFYREFDFNLSDNRPLDLPFSRCYGLDTRRGYAGASFLVTRAGLVPRPPLDGLNVSGVMQYSRHDDPFVVRAVEQQMGVEVGQIRMPLDNSGRLTPISGLSERLRRLLIDGLNQTIGCVLIVCGEEQPGIEQVVLGAYGVTQDRRQLDPFLAARTSRPRRLRPSASRVPTRPASMSSKPAAMSALSEVRLAARTP